MLLGMEPLPIGIDETALGVATLTGMLVLIGVGKKLEVGTATSATAYAVLLIASDVAGRAETGSAAIIRGEARRSHFAMGAMTKVVDIWEGGKKEQRQAVSDI